MHTSLAKGAVVRKFAIIGEAADKIEEAKSGFLVADVLMPEAAEAQASLRSSACVATPRLIRD